MEWFNGVKDFFAFNREDLEDEVKQIKEETAHQKKKLSEKEAIQKIIDSPRIYFKSLESFNKYYNTYFRVLLKASRGEYDVSDDELKQLKIQFAFLKVAGNFTDFLEGYMEGGLDQSVQDKYGVLAKEDNDKIYWN